MTGPGVDLVVSRFDEDVSWLHDVVDTLASHNCTVTVYLYDKGATGLDSSTHTLLNSHPGVTVKLARLCNFGRESHTYLEHVLHMRMEKNNADAGCVTVFLQGRMQDHVPPSHSSLSSFVSCMVREAAQSLLGESSNHACHTQYGAFNANPGLKVAMYPGVGDSGLNLGQWVCTFIGPWIWSSVENGPTWWQHGVFAIRTCRLLASRGRVDDAYYHALRAQVDWHVNPEAGHFFERSWYLVFPCLDQSENGAEDVSGNVIVGEYPGKADPGAPNTDENP